MHELCLVFLLYYFVHWSVEAPDQTDVNTWGNENKKEINIKAIGCIP